MEKTQVSAQAEKEKTVTQNWLIAEFMGAKIVSLEEVNRICKTSYTDETRPADTKEWIFFDAEGNQRDHKLSNLKYHSSWDWLMPVIDRLEQHGYAVFIGDKDDEYFETKVYYALYDMTLASSYESYCKKRSKRGNGILITWNEVKMLSVYSAVVKAIEFINWYKNEKAESVKGMTPEQKAKHLGVPLLVEIDEAPVTEEDKAKEKQARDEAMKMILAYANETVAVCGKCGKEVSRRERSEKQPCGDNDCPFGYLTNGK